MQPRMHRRLKLETPSPGDPHPDSGNPTNSIVTVYSRGYIAQNPVSEVTGASELRAGQSTVISTHTVLVPVGTPITSATVVTDLDDAEVRYRVVGEPAVRRTPKGRALFIAAAAQRISDMP